MNEIKSLCAFAKCAIEDTAMTATKTLLQYRYPENCESFGEADGNKKISSEIIVRHCGDTFHPVNYYC